jgi:hypothetical protein
MKISNIICQIAEVTTKRVKYIVDNDNRLRTHFTSSGTTFDYTKLVENDYYVISCENIDGIWTWLAAIPLDMSKKF